MKLFVTGGAGFIGAHFIAYWLRSHPQDTVVNFDALTYAAQPQYLSQFNGDSRYIFVKGNIADPEAVAAAMQGSDVVVHFAAETHVDRSVKDPAAFITTNVVGTHVLLEAAREIGVRRFHHISTDEVFGSLELNDSLKFSETTPYHPHSPYSASKAGSDHLVRAYHSTYGLPITISNCSNNYGPQQYPEKLIPVMVLKALQGERLPMYGDGKNVRDWIHVLDHCKGIEAILEKGVEGETYCLGGNAERANIEIATAVLDYLGKPHELIEFVKDRPGRDRRYAIDSTKAFKTLGWQPEYSFEDGLAETVDWYVAHQEELHLDEQGAHL